MDQKKKALGRGLEQLFNNEIPCFRVCGVKNGDITPSIKLSKAEIVIGLEELKKETIFK